MADYRTTAAKVRIERERHPERFCRYPRCLWRTHRDGVRFDYCRKHERRFDYCRKHERRFDYCRKHERSVSRAETGEASGSRQPLHPAGDSEPLPAGASSDRELPRCANCGDWVLVGLVDLDEGWCLTCGTVTWEPEYRTDAEQAEYERQREARS